MIITIIGTLIFIFGIATISEAFTFRYIKNGAEKAVTVNNMNDKIYSISIRDFEATNIYYCIQRGQSLLWQHNRTYTVVGKASIRGNTSTGTRGLPITNTLNGKMAYILNQDNGTPVGFDAYKVKDTGPVVHAVWNNTYNWVQQIGKHQGVRDTVARNKSGDFKPGIEYDAEKYANDYQANSKITDRTNKNGIKATTSSINGTDYIRIGPFNWLFPNNLNLLTAYNQNGAAINGVKYSIYNGNTEQVLGGNQIPSGRDFYVSIPVNQGVTKMTKLKGRAPMTVYNTNMWFMECDWDSHQNLMIHESYKTTQDVNIEVPYNVPLLGHLKIKKVDKDNNTVKLQGVGFRILQKSSGKWVKQNANGTISYVNGAQNGTEFVTNTSGEILIRNLIVGNYEAHETKNPNYGYELIKGGIGTTVVVEKTTDFKIENKRKWIKLSGYVWVDRQVGSVRRNNLLNDNNYDYNDIMLNHVTVRLKDRRTSDTVKDSFTFYGGEYRSGYYQFLDVLVDEIENYYVEFEYDGLTYTNVIQSLYRNNGSKASEYALTRKTFNEFFTKVEGGTTESTGYTRHKEGYYGYALSYELDKARHTSSIKNSAQFIMRANTDITGYRLKNFYKAGQEELKYVNLGLYEREMPQTSIAKDLENIVLSINGSDHTYKYASRGMSSNEFEKLNGFSTGVKFGGTYGSMNYTRAIYKSDYIYRNSKDISKELEASFVYKIGIKNQSENLTTRVNKFTDYYDSRFGLQQVGTELDNQGRVIPDTSGKIKRTYATSSTGSEYAIAEYELNEDMRLKPQEVQYVYIQFRLSRAAIQNIVEVANSYSLSNVVEIESYSVFDQRGEIYAGIDKYSNPGSVNPEDSRTYQADTDSAPPVKLETKDVYMRETTGIVFVDKTIDALKTGEIRQGSGAYETGEKTLKDVKVTLREVTPNSEVKDISTKTDANGNYKFTNYIPGNYEVVFTWGNNEYKVQNYKGTVYNKDRYEKNSKNKLWHEQEALIPRYTDATDNYTQRLAIDNEIKKMMHDTEAKATIKTIDAVTPVMNIRIEKNITNSTEASINGNILSTRNKTRNIDFGIVERAKQDIELTKQVKAIKVSIPTGQLITDAKIVNGKMEGQVSNVTYMKADKTGNGFIRIEMDNALLQGAVVELTYEITAKNLSELEYTSKDYYMHGTQVGNVLTLKPAEIVDYLENGWAFDKEKNASWDVKTINQMKIKLKPEVYNGSNKTTTITEKTIVTTNALNKSLRPGTETSADLRVSKILTSTDEIVLENEVEIIQIDKDYGRITTSTPGNYVPGTGNTEPDDSTAETVIVTPSTGEDRNFIIQVAVGVTALIILGVGVVIIRKKVLKH